jgi:hypothetical protein
MFVDASPILPVHDVEEAPEYFLFVLDMHQEHACYVVHTLDVAYLRIIVAVGQQHVVQHRLPLNTFPVEIFALTLKVL